MRTGIYVYTPTTLIIQASEPVVLMSLDNRSISIAGSGMSTAVSPGIYKAVTSSAITVAPSPSIDVVIVPNSKDTWPDPPLAVVTTFHVTASNVKSFFTIPDAKSAAF
jgi:hypothetical protein